MARGPYHGTDVAKNDMVLHQDHRGRWRVDLVTSTGGTHQTLGNTHGFGSPEEAFSYALDQQHVKGLRGKSHVWIQQDDGYVSYEPEGAHLPFEPNLKWSRAYIDDLPDSAFLYVDRSCVRYQDSEGRTHPLSCRHFPYRNQNGNVDLNHLRNALSRIPQSNLSQSLQERTARKAEQILAEHGGYQRNGSLYAELQAAGCQLDHHESDLYVRDTPEARRILDSQGQRYTPFRSDADRQRWLDVPFAYEPFWEAKQRRNGHRSGYENNGPRTGILSDGTRVNVYLDESAAPTDQWTVVPHSQEWDSMARGDMREMLGISKHGSGSQWTEGMEGRHLGRKVAWVEVPDAVKRHIERRVVDEKMEMTANPRGSVVDEHAKRELELYIENEYALIGDPTSIGKSIDANLRKKVAKGKYDPALAPKAWQYLIDEGAKRYAKAYSSSERDATQIFNAATRRAVAAEFARAWEAENLPAAATRS